MGQALRRPTAGVGSRLCALDRAWSSLAGWRGIPGCWHFVERRRLQYAFFGLDADPRLALHARCANCIGRDAARVQLARHLAHVPARQPALQSRRRLDRRGAIHLQRDRYQQRLYCLGAAATTHLHCCVRILLVSMENRRATLANCQHLDYRDSRLYDTLLGRPVVWRAVDHVAVAATVIQYTGLDRRSPGFGSDARALYDRADAQRFRRSARVFQPAQPYQPGGPGRIRPFETGSASCRPAGADTGSRQRLQKQRKLSKRRIRVSAVASAGS